MSFDYPRVTREQRRRLLSKSRARAEMLRVGVRFGSGPTEGIQPGPTPDYYSLSADDRRVLEQAMDDTRSSDPSLAGRAQNALKQAFEATKPSFLNSVISAVPILGPVAGAAITLGMLWAGFRVRGQFNFSADAMTFVGVADTSTYGPNRGILVVAEASYDPTSGAAHLKGAADGSQYGCHIQTGGDIGFAWRSGAAGLTGGGGGGETALSAAISAALTASINPASVGGPYDCSNVLEFYVNNPASLGPGWDPAGDASRRNLESSPTLSPGQSLQLCGYNIAEDGSHYGWSCRDIGPPGSPESQMPTYDMGELQPDPLGTEPIPDDLEFTPEDLEDIADLLRGDPDYGEDVLNPCDPIDLGGDPGLPGEDDGSLPGAGAGAPVTGGTLDPDGGSVELPEEPPGYEDPTKPGGIGDGNRPGDEVCVEIESGYWIDLSDTTSAAYACLQDGTEQAWESDPDDEVERLYPPNLSTAKAGGAMDFSPGASCIATLTSAGWTQTENTATIVRVAPPRREPWFHTGKRCGPIERTTPREGGGVKIDLPPCVPNRTRFEERTCYKGPIQDVISDLIGDMNIDSDKVVYDSESALVLRKAVCFPPGMRKRKALDYFLKLAGWGIFPAPDCTIIIGLSDPLGKVWTYHEDIDLLAFDLEWDRYEAYAFVMITKPPERLQNGRITSRGYSVMVPVASPVAVEQDKIYAMTAPRGMSEGEALAAAQAKAREIARLALPIIQFAVPANSRMRLRHQLDIVRPTKGFRGRYMVTKLGRDIDRDDGDLSVGQARWVVQESSTP